MNARRAGPPLRRVVLPLIGLAAAAYRAFWWEPRHVRVTSRRLALRRWPGTLDGLRVAVIADLHTGAPHVSLAKLERVVTCVNTERPDLVALLGDYVDPRVAGATEVPAAAVAAALGRLQAPLGAVAVLGNHDWVEGGRELATALRAAGIEVLENEAVPVGRGLWVAGLADARLRRPDIGAALAAPPEDAPVLLLSHNPDVFPEVPDRVALTISGHTHGAQVDLPLLRDRATPSRFGARYAGGVFDERERLLFVSRGVGTSGLPVRFMAPPEVALLELAGREKPTSGAPSRI